MLENKKTETKMKSTLDGHISVLKIAKERGVSLMKGQQKFLLLKCEKRMQKTKQDIKVQCDNLNRCNIYIVRIPKQKREKRAQEIFEVIIAKILQS